MTKWDLPMMKTAFVWAKQSKCVRAKVGAVIAKENRIIAIGYNGTPSGYKRKVKEVCSCCDGEGKVKSIDKLLKCFCCNGEGFVYVPYRYDCEEEQEIIVSKCCNTEIREDKKEKKVFCSKCGKQIGIIDFMNGSDNYRIVGDFEVKKELKTNHSIVIHAEVNAISFAARYGIPLEGTTMYITMSPCSECAKAIVQAGIKEVVYYTEYKDTNGISFLKENGVKVRQYQGVIDENT